MDRLAFLAEHVDLPHAVALEIGALDRPVLKPGSADVRYLDHLTTDGLREKYRNDPAVNKARLVDVRYVWEGGPMSSAVPDGQRFDVVVASHVFEHIPDPVGWLLDARNLLRDDGRIFLVLPDRRFTFDLKRRDSTLTDWIGWHLRCLRKPSPDQVFDHFAQACHVPAHLAWRGVEADGFQAMYETAVAYDVARSSAEEDRYVDVHCSVFTPYRFVGLCRELDRLNLFPYRIAGFQPTPPNGIEFFVLLQAGGDTSTPVIDRERQQQLARRAGYSGAFGGGLFQRALDADPALKDRYESLRAEERAVVEARWAEQAAHRFPALDPALHHDRPRPGDPQV